MKVIVSVVHSNNFCSDIIDVPMDWSEFKNQISNALDYTALRLSDLHGKSLMYESSVYFVLSYIRKFWYLINDDNRIMIRALDSTSLEEKTFLFERVIEKEDEA